MGISGFPRYCIVTWVAKRKFDVTYPYILGSKVVNNWHVEKVE